MPVLFQICVEGNTGSTGRMAEGLGIFAMQNGWESIIANGRFTRPSKSTLLRIGTDWEVFLHGLQTRFFDRHCLGSKWATKRLVKKIEKLRPDVIHLHHLHGYYINIEILFNYLAFADIPVVWTFHDCWSVTGHCTFFDFIGCDKWERECNNCPQKKNYPGSYLVDRSRKNYYLKKALFNSVKRTTIVSVSKWMDSIVKKSFLMNISSKVIYNGIDISLFKQNNSTTDSEIRTRFEINDKFMILGVASPWSDRKGLSDFVELSKLLTNNDIILLVGLDENQISKLPSNIVGIAKTENQQELIDIYSAADLFLNLSVEESFGLTTVEALACGTPAIVYDTTACPELIDEQTGSIVRKKDIKGVLEVINRFKNIDKNLFSEACRSRAVRLYNKEERYAEYFELYKKIIGVG
jgi:putative colanic acid biosynthesis glycosyltransferase